jgi:hypothetical protein
MRRRRDLEVVLGFDADVHAATPQAPPLGLHPLPDAFFVCLVD